MYTLISQPLSKWSLSLTQFQIEYQNPVLKITFSHRTGQNGDISLHTGQLGDQNVLKFIGKYLAQPGAAVQLQENGFFILYFDSISNWVTTTWQHEFWKKRCQFHSYFKKHSDFHFPNHNGAFGPKNPK